VSTGALAGVVMVPFIGATMCVAPAITRPTVPFGVRVPAERARATVIGQQRRAYYGRTAAIGICCTVAAVLLRDYGSWWLSRLILLLEVASDLGCYWIARKKITAVKQAENWYAGHRQVVATDTNWRSDPPRFPVPWLIPALAVIAATVTVLWTGLMLIVYRSRPDIEAADAAASTRRYRRALAAVTRAVLVLLALVDLSLLLGGLRQWQPASWPCPPAWSPSPPPPASNTGHSPPIGHRSAVAPAPYSSLCAVTRTRARVLTHDDQSARFPCAIVAQSTASCV
jgi:hypothetical protein